MPYVHRFGRRDGVCTDGTRRSELINPDAVPAGGSPAQRRLVIHIDALYREWKRTRDEDALRQLHAAISDQMAVT